MAGRRPHGREPVDTAWVSSSEGSSPVQTPILDGLSHVFGGDLSATGKVRDGPRHFQDPVVRPSREAESVDGPLEDPGNLGGWTAKAPELAGAHLAVVVGPRQPGESDLL